MSCEKCNNGWLITERRGISGAERCPCSAPIPPSEDEQLKASDCIDAVRTLAAMNIDYFPRDERAQEYLAAEFAMHFRDRDTLARFVRVGLYLSKWEGLDKAWQLYAGISETDSERRLMERDTAQVNENRRAFLAAGGRPRLIGAPADSASLRNQPVSAASDPQEARRAKEAAERLKTILTAPAERVEPVTKSPRDRESEFEAERIHRTTMTQREKDAWIREQLERELERAQQWVARVERELERLGHEQS